MLITCGTETTIYVADHTRKNVQTMEKSSRGRVLDDEDRERYSNNFGIWKALRREPVNEFHISMR